MDDQVQIKKRLISGITFYLALLTSKKLSNPIAPSQEENKMDDKVVIKAKLVGEREVPIAAVILDKEVDVLVMGGIQEKP